MVESAIKFTSSEEAAETKKALDLTASAASNINKNMGSVLNNITTTWKDSMQGEILYDITLLQRESIIIRV